MSMEIVDKLKNALDAAKRKIVEQQVRLKQLTAPPFCYVTVVSVKDWVDSEGMHKPADFIPGTRVRISEKSEFSRQNKSIGKITPHNTKRKGWVRVEFKSGNVLSSEYRIGLPDVDDGECDLVPVRKNALVAHEGKLYEVAYPEDKNIRPGQTVKMSLATLQIVDVTENQEHIGEVTTVRGLVDEVFCEVNYQDTSRVVYNGEFSGKLEKGDRVVLDHTASIILRNLGKNDNRFKFDQETNVTWDDIGGLEEAKKEMIEIIEYPLKHKDVYSFYHKKPVKGVLLWGPPGNGKTMLAKAAATSLAKLYTGNGNSSGFFYVKGPELLSHLVSVAEHTIQNLFVQARKHKKEKGYPAIIFIDEADSLMRKRGTGISSDIEHTIVPMFLAEMDGLEDSGAIVILATNRPDILDPAVVRDGRVDRKIRIDRPTLDAAMKIFHLYLRNTPIYNTTTIEVTKAAAQELFSEKRVLYDICLKGEDDKVLPFTLGHICSGAMIAGIVDQSTSLAIQRDLGNGGPKGITTVDIANAVEKVFQQNIGLNHNDDLSDFVSDFRDDVLNIRKSKQIKAGGA